MALPLSLKSLLAQLRFEPFFGIHLLQSPGLLLKLFHALDHGYMHTGGNKSLATLRSTISNALDKAGSEGDLFCIGDPSKVLIVLVDQSK